MSDPSKYFLSMPCHVWIVSASENPWQIIYKISVTQNLTNTFSALNTVVEITDTGYKVTSKIIDQANTVLSLGLGRVPSTSLTVKRRGGMCPRLLFYRLWCQVSSKVGVCYTTMSWGSGNHFEDHVGFQSKSFHINLRCGFDALELKPSHLCIICVKLVLLHVFVNLRGYCFVFLICSKVFFNHVKSFLVNFSVFMTL